MGTIKIATWNVNSLRVRLPQVLEWLAAHQPDILAVQETKVPDTHFPVGEIVAAGYRAAFSGQKGYNGVAILSRTPATDVVRHIPGVEDEQRRVLAASIDGLRVVNLYVPNGAFVGSDKYEYKLDWLDKLTGFLRQQLELYPKLIVVGDFNIAPEPRDVYDPDIWEGQVLFSEPERAAFRRLLALGLCDTFRLYEPSGGHYTWWDYRIRAFSRNQGLRIDHILTSPMLSQACVTCHIDRTPRSWDKPSDHAPVICEFGL
jgi:exodeoxyribonuclease-3